MRYWLALIVLCLTGQMPARAQDAPIWIQPDVMARHRIAGEIRFRSTGTERRIADPIPLDVIVDERGRVASVRRSFTDRLPDNARNERLRAQAIATVRSWRFRPFQRDGRARPARGIVTLAAVPAVRIPARPTPFPAFRPADLEIELARSSCEGCLHYVVRVRGDGQVQIVLFGGALVEGTYDYAIPVERVDRLVALFRAADFGSLAPIYGDIGTHAPRTDLRFSIGDMDWHGVTESNGAIDGMPDSVPALAAAIDEAVDSARWTEGNERSLATIEGLPNFSFRNVLGTNLLFALIASEAVPEALVLAVLDRGVPIDAPSPCSSCPETSDRDRILYAAILNGRFALFDRLNTDESIARVSEPYRDRLLQAAANVRSPRLIEKMVARGASAATPGPGFWQVPPLIEAVLPVRGRLAPDADQAAVIRLLLRHGAVVDARNHLGRTALQYAHDDPPEIARLLIAAGADVDAATDDMPPILYTTDDEEIALIALGAGADRTLHDREGYALAEIARRKGWRRVEAMLAP
jgi:hypothetical protein